MCNRAVRSILLDFVAGSVAIVVVVGSCFAFSRVSFDYRAIFAITGVAFFVAGLSRGSWPASLLWQSLRVSAAGLLGVAALILNNGLHRLSFPASLLVEGVVCAGAGILARRAWPQNHMRSVQIAAGAFLVVASSTLAAIPNLPAFSSFDAKGPQSPGFDLSVDTRIVNSSSLHGHVTVLAFYASLCAACFQELPEVATVYHHFQSDPRVVFYAVDTGWEGETAERGKTALLRRQIDLPMAYDAGGAARALKIDALPSLVLLDAEGSVRSVHVGFDRSENLESALERHILGLLQ